MPSSATTTTKSVTPIRYDYQGSIIDETGLAADALASFAPKLEAARHEVLDVDSALYSSGKIPSDKAPLDAAFLDMPERLLEAYESKRDASELGQILASAQRLAEKVDRVVLLGIGGSYMGMRALMEGCCHPYHNELSRSERGGRPRMYFEGNNVDNDSFAGLLDLLAKRPGATDIDNDWGIVVISKSGGTLETAVSFRIFLEALREQGLGDRIPDLVVPVTGRSGKLFDLATELGCRDLFYVPDGVGGRFSILSPVGLLPAAILGIDIVKLLQSAVAMNDHFRTAPVGENCVLDYVGVCHLLEENQGINLRVLSVWAKSLESVGLWYDQLLAESLGKQERGATPFTVVNTRDLHSRAQQHQEGTRDKLMTNVIAENWRRDALVVNESAHNQDQLNDLAGKSVPQIMSAAIAGTNQAYHEDRRPTADIRMRMIDEESLGQLFQMLMLATVVEGRLMGINPYGQPGVEAYKRNMKQHLGLK